MNNSLIPGRNLFGSPYDEDSDGTDDYFLVGLPLSENALTPVREADIPVTDTVLLDTDGYVQIEPGYVKPGKDNFPDRVDDDPWSASARTIYLHGGIQFTPLRVEGERIEPGANQTVYTARHGNWLGLHNPTTGGATYSIADALWWAPPGALPFPSFPALIYSSELRPRIVVPAKNLDTDDLHPIDDPDPGSSDLSYDVRWNSPRGTVSVWLPYIDVTGDGIPDPAQAFAVFDVTAVPVPGGDWPVTYTPTPGILGSAPVYTVPGGAAQTTLSLGVGIGDMTLPVDDSSDFVANQQITIGTGATQDTQTIDTVPDGSTITITAGLVNVHAADEPVVATDDSANAPSIYTITPQPQLAPMDKMIVPDSVRVWAVGENLLSSGSTQQASLEYTRVSVSDQSDLRPGQFRLVPSDGSGGTNYTTVQIQFGNSSSALNTPPPSPDDPKTYGAPANWKPGATDEDESLNAFYILVQYQYRRNFDTAAPDVNDYDIIEVSYSTREVYNIALEVMPYRYLEEVATGVWRPYGPATGVQMRAQVEVRNLSR